ncbi:MAG: hypothetical protein WC933_01290 [Candidatus Paceibacterota bacterium]|jgi:hypothetical protein
MNKDNFLDPAENPKDPQDIMTDKIIKAHLGKDDEALTININDYIAMLTIAAANEKDSKKIDTENLIKILGYLRDKYKAETAYKALQIIKEKKVPINIIGLWIEEHMISEGDMLDAIKEGYPELVSSKK